MDRHRRRDRSRRTREGAHRQMALTRPRLSRAAATGGGTREGPSRISRPPRLPIRYAPRARSRASPHTRRKLMPKSLLAARVALALVVFYASSASFAFAGIGDVYVTSDASNQVRQYNGTSGAYQTVFTTAFAANGELGIHFGATNNRVLIGHWSGGVEEFNATSGAYIQPYNPGGGTQWAGLYGPTGGVYIGDWSTNDVREYDSTTGAFIRVVTPVQNPADMRLDGNRLYIASFNGGYVLRVNATTGAFAGQWSTPPVSQPNDVVVLPSGEILVTCMRLDQVWRYRPVFALLGTFAGTGWVNP